MAKVLLLDDEPEILNLLSDEFKRLGHDVVTVRFPAKALELLREEHNGFDLVVCDLVMPQKNGIDFVKELDFVRTFRGQVAFISSYVSMLDREIKDAGVNYVLKKPFTLDVLDTFIERIPLKMARV